MKNSELRALKRNDLDAKIVELKSILMKENAQIAIGTTPKSPGSIKTTKKTIARLLQLRDKTEE